MVMAPDIAEFWARFKATLGEVDDAHFYEAFHFGDNDELADSLARLVLGGRKRATVDLVAFDDVTAEFAAVEGEGDGSLVYWRQGHTEYFARECARIGRMPSGSMLFACERFAVVYRPPR